MSGRAAIVLAAALFGACGQGGFGPDPTPPPPRDWAASPAIVTIDAPPVLYAMSDVHGGYDRMASLLARNHLIARVPATPAEMAWVAHDAVLVVTGDLIDKGPRGLEVVAALMALEQSAAAAGGRVVVTLGNHEVEFFADPQNHKADGKDGLDVELAARGIAADGFSDGGDPRGAWLLARPFAARVGDVFLAHAGATGGRTIEELAAALEAAVDGEGYRASEVTGGDSVLEARGWYDGDGVAADAAAAVGARHIVFGHDPGALGPRGRIARSADGVLFRIDCGMSPDVDDSEGALLRLRFGEPDEVDELGADGAVRHLSP